MEITMNFITTIQEAGEGRHLGLCHVRYVGGILKEAWIDIYLTKGLPLRTIMHVITHEILHWIIIGIDERAGGSETSEWVIKDLMNGYPPKTIVLDGKY